MFPVLPPGLTVIVGLLFVIVATQMLIGLELPWLPGGVRRYTLSARAKQILQQRGIPFLRHVEQFARPRQLWIPDAISTRVVAIALFLFGLVNRDGFLLVGGLALSAGVVAVGIIGAEKLVVLLGWFLRRP